MTRPAVAEFTARRALGLAGGFTLLVLTLATPSTSRMFTWPWALLAAALAVIPPLLLGIALLTKAEWRWPGRVALTGLILLCVAAVISSLASPFAGASLPRVWPTLAGSALCCVLYDRAKRDAGDNVVAHAIAAMGGIVLILSVAQWLWRVHAVAGWTNRNDIPFGHSTYTAGFAVLVMPWLGWAAWTARGIRRSLWVAVAVMGLVALISSGSRGGIAALVASVAVLGAVIAWRFPWSAGRKATFLAVLVGLGIAAALANPRLRDVIVRRGWSATAHESNRQRSAMFAAGMRLGAERPLLGWGPGTVPLAYPKVRAQLNGGVEDVLQLHDTPVQIWATLGGVGVLAVLLFGIASARAIAALWRGPVAPVAIAAALSLLSYAVFALTDHQLDVPAMAALVAADFAFVLAAIPTPPTPRRIPPWITVSVWAAICAAPTFALVRDLRARFAYDQGLTELEHARHEGFVAAMDAATAITPFDPYFDHQAAADLLARRESIADSAARAKLTSEAIARLERSLTTRAHEEYAHFNLGWLELEAGHPEPAARHFAAAARLAPDKGGVYFGLGLALDALGRHHDAVRAFALEWVNDPQHALSPAWEIPKLAAYVSDIRREVLRILADLQPMVPQAAMAAAWSQWSWGQPVPGARLDGGFTDAAAAFAATQGRNPPPTTTTPVFNWERLLVVWQQGDFRRLSPNDPAFAAALARRAARHPHDFNSFLTASSEDEAALVLTYRRQRLGYGVLALHPEGPPLTDLYVVQENRVISTFAADLLPPKGWIPGRFLLALLPPEPR